MSKLITGRAGRISISPHSINEAAPIFEFKDDKRRAAVKVAGRLDSIRDEQLRRMKERTAAAEEVRT